MGTARNTQPFSEKASRRSLSPRTPRQTIIYLHDELIGRPPRIFFFFLFEVVQAIDMETRALALHAE
jgi:hypothetical protein